MRSIYLFVSGEGRKARTAWMFGDGGHRVHVRFGNVFDDYWDIVVPSTYRFIVRGRNETTILIDESNSIDRPKMLIIRLNDFVRSQIVLHVSPTPHTNNVDIPG